MPIIIYNVKVLSIIGFEGITFAPYIFISHREKSCPPWLINHEKVHIKQQEEKGLFLFTLIYLWDYAKGLFVFRTHRPAYLNIRFEKAAYALWSPPEKGGSQ